MAKAQYFFGIHAVTAILQHRPHQCVALFVQTGREQDSELAPLLAAAKVGGVSVQPTHKDKLTSLARSHQHQGVVVQARPLPEHHEVDVLNWVNQQPPCLLLVLDQVTDPHNLGACMRTALAMGVTAVVVPKNRAAGLTPTVVKVAAGATEQLPFVTVTNLARTLRELKQAGVFVVGTALDDTAKPIQQCDLTGNVAVVMGAEGEGMRRLTAEHCDQLAYIPMTAAIQSLNVSVATGMVLYEATKQRGCFN